MNSSRTRHTTVTSPEREDVVNQLRKSPELVEKLIHMYYYDFVLFGYEIPSVPLP